MSLRSRRSSVSLDLIARLAASGVIVSLGHSDATAEAGARLFRRGRALRHASLQRDEPARLAPPGVVGAALADARIFAGFIADGVHVEDTAGGSRSGSKVRRG